MSTNQGMGGFWVERRKRQSAEIDLRRCMKLDSHQAITLGVRESAMTALDLVKSYVKSAQVGPDGRLPPERELVTILGLTRNQVRTAFKKLEAQGLIWRHVGKGTFVGSQPRQEPVVDALVGVAPAEMTNPREVIEARFVIEPAIVRFAAMRASPAAIGDLDRRIDEMRRASSPEHFQQLDRQWHARLAAAAGNALLASFVEVAQKQTDPNIWGRLRTLYMSSDRMAEAIEEHTRVLDAIRSRDPAQAEELMRRHIVSVRACVFNEHI